MNNERLKARLGGAAAFLLSHSLVIILGVTLLALVGSIGYLYLSGEIDEYYAKKFYADREKRIERAEKATARADESDKRADEHAENARIWEAKYQALLQAQDEMAEKLKERDRRAWEEGQRNLDRIRSEFNDKLREIRSQPDDEQIRLLCDEDPTFSFCQGEGQ